MARLDGQPVLKEINRRQWIEPRLTPFQHVLERRTIQDYASLYCRIFLFILAFSPTLAVNLFRPADLPLPPVVLLEAIVNLFSCLFATNPQAAPNDHQGLRDLESALINAATPSSHLSS
ncbi:uncharacterized protein LY79DRAFT_672806 [Colletotrichum navitas]|uniref:Uncharacterized protein n=1 Tax=Colletotrichum navitas TaxID=681940 RepID=A0AAD8PRT2_9PEZI|nr:uncharacterized protein LY79DRAFT_672806 [Colletotrichum navitas]KAK1574595.1 hypothetical protein LY79DRAFT_672806 [Colletotrichum navitas]